MKNRVAAGTEMLVVALSHATAKVSLSKAQP